MISAEVKAKYKATIGIECHVQLKTVTKLFESVGNDAREASPNTLVSHISFGLPGALPVLNKDVVRLASKMAFALNTEPQRYSIFERKHYFYPDLPMGYQISQLHQPVVVGGEVNIEVDGQTKKIHINRVQIEADAGKNTHPAGQDYSLVDLNRAGTPLLEIVSEADMHSAGEAKAYVRELYLLVKYANVSDADLYHGNMRFDVNVSVSPTDELGTRTETKNLNSFRSVEKAAEFEIARQIELLEKGQVIVQETRGWDDAKQKTISQRGKEEAHDYRYMPDPDLPPITLDDAYIEKVRSKMPNLPPEIRNKLKEVGIDESIIEDLLDNEDILKEVLLALEKSGPADARNIAFYGLQSKNEDNVITSANQAYNLNDRVDQLITLSGMQLSNVLASTAAKEIAFQVRANIAPQDIKNLIEEKKQVSDEGEIAKIVEQVLKDNAKAAEDVKNGEAKAIGFLVGQVMKASQGKANPTLAQDLIKKQLGV